MKTFARTILVAALAIAIAFLSITSVTAVTGAEAVQEAAPAEEAAPESEEKKEDPEAILEKIRTSEHKLKIAELKLEVAMMDADTSRQSAETTRRHALEELEIASAKLEQYETIDARNEIEQAELALRGARDRAQEAAEELAQIELMYEGQDLDDRTAEFVVQRGRRNAERAAARIAIDERRLEALVKHQIPRETRSRELDVARKQAALENAVRTAKSGALQKRIAILNAEAEVDKLQRELEELRAKQGSR